VRSAKAALGTLVDARYHDGAPPGGTNLGVARGVGCVALRALFDNPDETQHVFEIIDVLQGVNLYWMRNRLCTDRADR